MSRILAPPAALPSFPGSSVGFLAAGSSDPDSLFTALSLDRPVSLPGEEFDQFFVANYERLVRSLTAITGDVELARDAVQDAFVKASSRWRRVSRYDDPVGWVRRVAINRSRDLHRSEQRRRNRERRVTRTDDGIQPDQTANLVGSFRLAELFAALPEQQRRAASLFYVEQLSVAEIAATLAISPGAVKFHLNRARAALRVIVEQDQVDG